MNLSSSYDCILNLLAWIIRYTQISWPCPVFIPRYIKRSVVNYTTYMYTNVVSLSSSYYCITNLSYVIPEALISWHCLHQHVLLIPLQVHQSITRSIASVSDKASSHQLGLLSQLSICLSSSAASQLQLLYARLLLRLSVRRVLFQTSSIGHSAANRK